MDDIITGCGAEILIVIIAIAAIVKAKDYVVANHLQPAVAGAVVLIGVAWFAWIRFSSIGWPWERPAGAPRRPSPRPDPGALVRHSQGGPPAIRPENLPMPGFLRRLRDEQAIEDAERDIKAHAVGSDPLERIKAAYGHAHAQMYAGSGRQADVYLAALYRIAARDSEFIQLFGVSVRNAEALEVIKLSILTHKDRIDGAAKIELARMEAELASLRAQTAKDAAAKDFAERSSGRIGFTRYEGDGRK